jgi:hypothetical protein
VSKCRVAFDVEFNRQMKSAKFPTVSHALNDLADKVRSEGWKSDRCEMFVELTYAPGGWSWNVFWHDVPHEGEKD